MPVKKPILTQKMYFARFFMALCLGVLASQARPDELTDAQHFLDAGAAQLVLQQMDAAGVPESPTTRNEWLRVQWQALAMAGAPQEILDQAARLPKDIPDALRHDADLLAARAAIQLGQGGLARKYLSVLLWQLPVQAAELPDLRALVVQSHLLPVPDAEAASLMLRDQQDFGIDPVLRKAYILAVLRAGQTTDLSSLRSGLADSDPLAVLIDAHAGRLSDDELRNRIGALLQGNALDEPLLLALRQTVAGMNAESLQVQIDERLLNLPEPPSGINALLVWKAYHSMTQSFGNVRLLLFGSDAGWAEQAQGVAAQDPVMARAIWAYLAREAKDDALRATAQQQFLDQMAALQLGRAALRLFEAAWPDLPAQGFAPPVRYRLGQLALAAGEDAPAAQLWQAPAQCDGR